MRDSTFTLLGVTAIALVFAVCFGIAAAGDYISCKNRWAGFAETRWGVLSGCQLKLNDGRWIPAEAVREIPL